MAIPTQTIAIPVSKGIDINTAARLVQPPNLLEAINSSFAVGSATKRYGHTTTRAVNGAYPPGVSKTPFITPTLTSYGDKILDPSFLFGWGVLTGVTQRASDNSTYESSPYPEAGHLFGVTNRDSEVLGWNGSSLFSYAPEQVNQGLITPAVMPVLRAKPIAKATSQAATQLYPDIADNGIIRVVAWIDSVETGFRYNVYSSSTGAPLLIEAINEELSWTNIRVVPVGKYVHIYAYSLSAATLVVYSINQETPTTYTKYSQGDCTFFDCWKMNENAIVLGIVTSAGGIKTRWLRATGENAVGFTNADINIGGNTVSDLSICVHPNGTKLGIAFTTTPSSTPAYTLRGIVTTLDGSPGNITNLETLAPAEQGKNNTYTIIPRWFNDATDDEIFDVYATFNSGTIAFGGTSGGDRLVYRRFSVNGLLLSNDKFHMRVMSQGMRCGDRTFVWVGHKNSLQPVWILVDEGLNPVGKLAYGIANVPEVKGGEGTSNRSFFIRSMNWRMGAVTLKDVLCFHGGFSYVQRLPVTDDQSSAVYTEPSILFSELDFLPHLRTAQAGRCTYIAGAQLWAYDGKELMESGFHIAPEFSLSHSGGGGLTDSGTYSYRVDLCYRNEQNEEIRSASFLSQVTLPPGDKTITLNINSVLTRRSGSYFLIFRNAMISGEPTSQWNLINSRDPSNAHFLLNNQSIHSITYTDDGTITDTAGLNGELSPNNAGTSYLMPFTAPACEILSAGRDRLWVAGGELLPGQVAPSRLFEPGEIPAFHPNIWRQVDRSQDPITAIGFAGDVAFLFRRDKTYILEGDGPDNVANGFWAPARLALADIGAISQDSLALIANGLAFQSPGGFRLLGPGGALTEIGRPTDIVARDFSVSGAFVQGNDHEVRWYGPDGVFVYNYQNDCWSTWTCGSLGVAKNTNGRAILVVDSDFWVEDISTYTDGDTTYEHRLRFPWLHAGNLGDFQRLRRFAAFGTFTHPLSCQVKIYYDERDFYEEMWDWDQPDPSMNSDTWGGIDGDTEWGDGIWGDTTSTSGILKDYVWRFRRRPRRQKCSVFSISISDRSSNGPGFTMSCLGLELGMKKGLDRIPAVVGGTNINRG